MLHFGLEFKFRDGFSSRFTIKSRYNKIKETALNIFMSAQPKVGYKKALNLLEQCSCEHGFYASPRKKANYKRIWSRDGTITGLASLVSGKEELIKTFRRTLDTLLAYQGRQGEIPSNVSPESKRVSYGTLAGRVDAPLWYIIGCGKYYRHTKDQDFLDKHYPGLRKTADLLECWEFNRRGFLFIPEGGDWADEMPRRGYLFYDQVLYYLALGEFIKMRKAAGEDVKYWQQKKNKLKRRIRVNFWPRDLKKRDEKYVYHEAIFKQLQESSSNRFWLESFDAGTKRFDAFGNVLAIISGISDWDQNQRIIKYAAQISGNDLLPAFYPVIKRSSQDWRELQAYHLFEFKNKPYLYHNGGLWPMVNGFYTMALRRAGREDLADKHLEKVTRANHLHRNKGEKWGFYEYLHGKRKTPEGHPHMAWNAAGQIFAFKNKKIL